MTDLEQRARALLALAEKATPGPWESARHVVRTLPNDIGIRTHIAEAQEERTVDLPLCHANAAFIAASHDAAAIIRDQQSEIARLNALVEQWKKAHDDLIETRLQDIAAMEGRIKRYGLSDEIADLILRMQRGDYSQGTPLDLALKCLDASRNDGSHLEGPR